MRQRARMQERANDNDGIDVHRQQSFGSNQERMAQMGMRLASATIPAGIQLRQGDRGDEVRALQRALNTHGFNLNPDGVFGRGTRTALMIFQQRAGLTRSGIGDATTLSRLSTPPRTVEDMLAEVDLESREIGDLKIDPGIFENIGLRPKVFALALDAFTIAFRQGQTDSMLFTIIDFELSSAEKRLWTIDLANQRLLFHEQVTHGRGSDRNHDGYVDGASALSNRENSNQSNIGLLRTGEDYYSSKFRGDSLRLDGLESGFNDQARDRAIVMHPAYYADVREGQKMGRSQGCPALDPDVSGEIIHTIKDGSLLFQYYPDPNWLQHSNYSSVRS